MEFIQGKWKLDDLYGENYKSAIEADREKALELVNQFGKYREQLTPDISGELFNTIIADYEKILVIMYRIMAFCQLRFAEDTQSGEAFSLVSQNEAFSNEITSKTMFVDLWWKALDDENAARLIEACPNHRYHLSHDRLSRNHVLSEKEEYIINIKESTGASALSNIYDSITNHYVFYLNINGEEHYLTRGELMTYAQHANPVMREVAYDELYQKYAHDGITLGQIYTSIVRDWDQEALTLRKYEQPISARNLTNDIPDEIVDMILETCRKNRDVFMDYFKWKKEMLGLEEMRRFDLYAPIIDDTLEYSFDEGMKKVLAAYAEFDPEFEKMARSVYESGHIDSEVRPYKRGGAFCLTPGNYTNPYVLINYQKRLGDVSTLAHELGHAIHGIISKDNSFFQSDPCLPLAETASTFGEMLLEDYLEKNETNKDVLLHMLMKQIDDNYATIQRQAYFALFEKKAHQMVMEGADVESLNQAYLENLRDQFGDSMTVPEIFKWEWVTIPHIYHTPFYVYAYTFGQLLVLSLYREYQKQGESFIPRYKEMLRKGGSQKPGELLMDAGFDYTTEAFWQGGFDVLKEKIERLKALTK